MGLAFLAGLLLLGESVEAADGVQWLACLAHNPKRCPHPCTVALRRARCILP